MYKDRLTLYEKLEEKKYHYLRILRGGEGGGPIVEGRSQ